MWPQKKPYDPLGFLRVGNIVQPARGANTVQPQKQAPKPQQKPQLPSQFSALNRPTVQNQVQRTVNPNQYAQPQQQVTAPFRQPTQRIVQPAPKPVMPISPAMPQNTIKPALSVNQQVNQMTQPLKIGVPQKAVIRPQLGRRQTTPLPIPNRNPIQKFGDFAGKVNDATLGTGTRLVNDMLIKPVSDHLQNFGEDLGYAVANLDPKVEESYQNAQQANQSSLDTIIKRSRQPGFNPKLANQLLGNYQTVQDQIKTNADANRLHTDPVKVVADGGLLALDAASFGKAPKFLPGGGATVKSGAALGGGFGLAYGGLQPLSDSGSNANPWDVAKSAGMGLAGGTLMGAAIPAIKPTYKYVKNAATAHAVQAGERASGLPKVNVLNDNEAYTLADWGDYLGKRDLTDTTNPKVVQEINARAKQAYHAAKNAGVDIQSGSARDIQNRIADYLERRDAFKSGYKQASESGGVPAGMFDPTGGRLGKKPEAPQPTAALKQEALKYKSADEFVQHYEKNSNNIPQTPEYNAFVKKIDAVRKELDEVQSRLSSTDKMSVNDYNRNNALGKEYRQLLDNAPHSEVRTRAGTKYLREDLTNLYNKANADKGAMSIEPKKLDSMRQQVRDLWAAGKRDEAKKLSDEITTLMDVEYKKNYPKRGKDEAFLKSVGENGYPEKVNIGELRQQKNGVYAEDRYPNEVYQQLPNFIAKNDIPGTSIKSGDKVGLAGKEDGLLDAVLMPGKEYQLDGFTVSREPNMSIKDFRRITDGSKPTLQDALAGKSTKIKAQPSQKAETPQNLEARLSQQAQGTSRRALESPLSRRANLGLGKNSSVETPRTTGQTQRTPGRSATGTPKLRLGQSYTDSIQPKQSAVKDTKRALAGQERTTYGLRDSFDAGDSVPSDLKQALGAFGNERTVRSNKELWQTAQQRVGTDPVGAMDFFQKTNSDEAVAVGYSLINRYMKQGNVKEAGNIAMDMAERALEAGRTTQAYALMKRLTPEGHIAYVEKKVARFINKHPKQEGKLNWNDGVREQLYNMADQVQKMPEGRERNLLIGKMQETVDNIFPSSVVDKAITVWKAGLLTSFRTHERNILSNAINLASEQASTWPGAIADKLMSARTKQRTLIASTGEGILAGTKKGAQIAKDQIKTGVDVTNSNIKYNINHITWSDSKVEKTLKGFTEGVFRPLGAEDKLFKEAARSNSIRNQAYTAAKNKKLKGTDFDNAVSDLIDNPTPKMMDIAEQDAGRATFTHDNRLGEIIKDAKAAVRRSNKPGAKAASAALDILMPFTQVPSGVASQLYAYSPAKLVKSMYDIGKVMITNDTDLQRTAAQGFGRSVIGTSLLGAGAYLYSQGKMTGQPKDDQEKAQWEAQGIKPNSIKVGDRWYQISSIGPQAILALAGGQYVSDKDNGQDPNINLAANLGNSLKDQTFLKGMSSALDAIGDPNRYMQNYIDQQATSVVPNLVKDIARAFDPESRQTNGIVDKFKSSIPGLSNSLPQRYDSYGQPIHNDGVLEMVDLFNSSKQKQIDEVDYVQMLRDATGAKEHIPSKADRSIQINGATMKLTSQQQSDYQKYIGEKSKQVIGALAKDDNFISLSPDEKVKKIDNALKDINSAAKIELFGNQPKNVSSSVQDVLNGGDPSWSTGKEASYKQQYEKALSDFQKDGGSLSPIERAKKQKNIAYLSVQKDYDKDTVSLYGMGESDIYGLLDNLPEKESSQYFNMILKYGDALVEKGLLKTNKLRDRYGNVQYVRGSGGKVSYTTGGRSSGGRKASSGRKSTGRKSTGSKSGGTSNASFAAILAAQKKTNDLNNDTYGSLSKLLGGLAPKSQKRTIGQRAVTKKITVKGAKA